MCIFIYIYIYINPSFSHSAPHLGKGNLSAMLRSEPAVDDLAAPCHFWLWCGSFATFTLNLTVAKRTLAHWWSHQAPSVPVKSGKTLKSWQALHVYKSPCSRCPMCRRSWHLMVKDTSWRTLAAERSLLRHEFGISAFVRQTVLAQGHGKSRSQSCLCQRADFAALCWERHAAGQQKYAIKSQKWLLQATQALAQITVEFMVNCQRFFRFHATVTPWSSHHPLVQGMWLL